MVTSLKSVAYFLSVVARVVARVVGFQYCQPPYFLSLVARVFAGVVGFQYCQYLLLSVWLLGLWGWP